MVLKSSPSIYSTQPWFYGPRTILQIYYDDLLKAFSLPEALPALFDTSLRPSIAGGKTSRAHQTG